jgi:hypothetical protein
MLASQRGGPGLHSRAVHVEFVVDKRKLGQVSFPTVRFSLSILICTDIQYNLDTDILIKKYNIALLDLDF